MKKFCKLALALCFSIVACLAATSFKASAATPPTALSSTSYYMDENSHYYNLSFKSDVSWAAYIDGDFITSEQSLGGPSGTYTLKICVKANYGSLRTGSVTIRNGYGDLKFTFNQRGRSTNQQEIVYSMTRLIVRENGTFEYTATCNADVKFTVNGYNYTSSNASQLAKAGFYSVSYTKTYLENGYYSYKISGLYNNPSVKKTYAPVTIQPIVEVKPGYYLTKPINPFYCCVRNIAY